MKNQYDCVVVGGGPAGATTAALVAEKGIQTLLVEREKMPRFHVGESLMPETYWSLERLGVLDKLQNGMFTKKNGVQFVNHEGKESQPFFFRDADDRECADTLHVQRGEFDKVLFDNASEKGATCFDQTRVLNITLNDSGLHQVTLRDREGHEVTAPQKSSHLDLLQRCETEFFARTRSDGYLAHEQQKVLVLVYPPQRRHRERGCRLG